MSGLERRFSDSWPTPDYSHNPAYWFESSRVWLGDILPVLIKYKYYQVKRDQTALWTGYAHDVIERIERWLDRHGF